MNCHADTPAARAMTSSWLRVSRQKVNMALNSTMKWNSCCSTSGTFSTVMRRVSSMVTSGLVEPRRTSSMKSNSMMIAMITSRKLKNHSRNWRAI